MAQLTNAQFQQFLAAVSQQLQPRDHIAKPKDYKGEYGRDLDRFISQVNAYLAQQTGWTETRKVMAVIGFLADKVAQWAIPITDYMGANQGALPAEYDTWEKLAKELRNAFGDHDTARSAMIRLDALCNYANPDRKTRDVSEYITEFKTLAARTRLSDTDKIHRFEQGLPDRYQFLYAEHATRFTDIPAFEKWALNLYAGYQRQKETQALMKAQAKPATSTTTTRPSPRVRRLQPLHQPHDPRSKGRCQWTSTPRQATRATIPANVTTVTVWGTSHATALSRPDLDATLVPQHQPSSPQQHLGIPLPQQQRLVPVRVSKPRLTAFAS